MSRMVGWFLALLLSCASVGAQTRRTEGVVFLRTSAPTAADDLRLGDWWIDTDASPITAYILTALTPTWTAVATGEGIGHKIQDEAVSLTSRPTLNFTGAGITCADNAGNTRTDCTVAGGSGYSTIEDEGTPLTQRTTLNFEGRISCSDFGAETVCVVPTTPPTHNLLQFTAHVDTADDTPTLGHMIYGDGSLWTSLAGNTTTTKKFLTQTGTGAASAAPVWDTIVAGSAPAADDQVLVSDSTVAATWRSVPNCTVATQKLLYATATNTWSCQTDATGGGGSGNSVAVTATLTSLGQFYSVPVLAAWAGTTVEVVCRPHGEGTTTVTAETLAVAGINVTVGNVVDGNGFDVMVTNPYGLEGDVEIHCLGV